MSLPAARTALRVATRASPASAGRPVPWAAASVAAHARRPYAQAPNPAPEPIASTSTQTAAAEEARSDKAAAATSRPTGAPQPTNLPGSNLPSPSPASRYSPLTVSIVTKLAKLFGYHSQTSTAIRTTSDYYDRCAERGEVEAAFFYEGAFSDLSWRRKTRLN